MRHPRPRPRPSVRTLGGIALTLAALGASAAFTFLPTPVRGAGTIAAQPAQEGAVTLADGRTIEGTIAEGERDVVITANGIATTVAREQIRSIEYGSPQQRLQKRLDALPPEDTAGRLAVGEEALRRGLLDMAEQVGSDLRTQNPGNPRGQALLDQVARQREVQQRSGAGRRPATQPPGGAQAGGRANPGRGIRATEANVLSEEQINMLRQTELQPADANAGRDRPTISFRNNVVRRYTEAQPDFDFRQFNRLDDVSKALRILEDGGEDLWPDVVIASDPTAVRTFLRSVEPVVINGCATSECHGGANAGSFVLFRNPRDDAPTRLTNFYLVNTTSVAVAPESGAFGETAAARRLVDRESPQDSILLQYMLPYDKANNPHPRVEGYQGLVQTPDDENYRVTADWIANSLKRLTGRGYGFEFKPDLPQTRPATRPANTAGNRGGPRR